VLWELSKDILKKGTYLGKKTPGKMTSLNMKSVYKGKYLSQSWTPVLKGAFGRPCPSFKEMLRHLCHSNSNLINDQS
jgi:hypothetical protein